MKMMLLMMGSTEFSMERKEYHPEGIEWSEECNTS
jgi:hypothetical protein